MSHKYQQSFALPDDFQTILRDFTREVLREQPSNIYEFGYQFFTKLASEEGNEPLVAQKEVDIPKNIVASIIVETKEKPESPAVALETPIIVSGTPKPQNPEELKDRLAHYFSVNDPSHSGTSHISQVKPAILSLYKDCPLLLMMYVISDLEIAQDGSIDYFGFVETAGDALYGMYNNKFFEQHSYQISDQEQIHGLNKTELEDELNTMFAKYTNGKIPMSEFWKILEEGALDLGRKEITIILSETELDDQGNVILAKIIPQVYSLCVYLLLLDQIVATTAKDGEDGEDNDEQQEGELDHEYDDNDEENPEDD